MNDSQRPTARKEGLVIQEMPDEVLVFDTETNKAHCLNETAAFVWKACDGTNSVAEITKLFGDKSGKQVPQELVWLAIDQLGEKNLLDKKVEANFFAGQSRREVIKKIGLAAVIALPIVSSLVAPSSASAVTPCSTVNGTACTGQQAGQCCGGTCCVIGTCAGNVCGTPA
ncbi:MAG: PqqD family protein [Pyrinomonadaceae bacterium]